MDRRLFASLVLVFACSDDGGSDPEAPPIAEPKADAASPVTDSAAALVDAASGTPPDAGTPSPCAAGEIFCDDTCIAAIAPTAEAVQSRIFRTSCAIGSSCHGGTSPKAGLALDSVDNLFATAVGKTSTQIADRLIVSPAQPDRSYMVDKLRGQNLGKDPATGQTSDVMPQPPLIPLCSAKIDAVRAWVSAGAPR